MSEIPHLQDNLFDFTVSELAAALKRTVEDAFGRVRVRGEISGLRRANSGHCYFALKDEGAVLDAVLWRGTAAGLRIALEDGLEVVAVGRITTYAPRSKYQLVVEALEPAGLGALMLLLEERRRRLAAEGLFDPARKRPLPFLPEVIGVVTSPSGAVIRDILHRLGERFPRRVLLWPVLVQGEGAAEQIAAAIAGFSALPEGGPVPRPDVVIVARGGGSIEDLWPFNEEVVVRAAAASEIPLISAVGHETDVTLIDHAADRRAPTPTAAAEMAVPVRAELLAGLHSLGERLDRAVFGLLDRTRERLVGLARGLPDPHLLLGHAAQRLDDLAERLLLQSPKRRMREQQAELRRLAMRLVELTAQRLQREGTRLEGIALRLTPAPLRERLRLAERELGRETLRLRAAFRGLWERRQQALDHLGRQLEALSHRRVLERGYALVRRPGGGIVPRLAALDGARRLEIEFADGRLAVQRIDPRKARRPEAESQPGLFE